MKVRSRTHKIKIKAKKAKPKRHGTTHAKIAKRPKRLDIRKKAARKSAPKAKPIAHNEAERMKRSEAAKKIVIGLPETSEAKGAIDALLQNEKGITYLKKNVSRSIVDVISLLTVPRTDEYITEKLGIKINAVRRMLNIMQNYGITNYYISKNKNGWLSFAWYMNTNKLPAFLEYVRSVESEKSMIEDNCNDYFVCNNCYNENKLIFTFDAAYEAGFSCNACGKNLERLGGKGDVEKLISTDVPDSKAFSDDETKTRLSPK